MGPGHALSKESLLEGFPYCLNGGKFCRGILIDFCGNDSNISAFRMAKNWLNHDVGTTTPQQVLTEVFGHEQFRPGQAETIEASLAGRDILAVQPTGRISLPASDASI